MEPAQVELEWHAPTAACATEADFRQALQDRLGYDPVRPSAARHLTVRLVQRTSDRYEVVVTEKDAERAFEGACEDVVDDAALAAALALDPLRAHAPPPRPRAVPAPVPVLLPRPPPPPPPAAPYRGPRFEVGAGAGAAFGHVPDPSLRFGLEAGLAWPRVRVALQGDAGLPTTLDATVMARPVEVRVSPLRAAFIADYILLRRGPVSLGPLVGFAIERLGAEGSGTDHDSSSSVVVPRIAAGARFTVRVAGPRDPERGLRLVLDGAGSVATGNTSLVIRSAGERVAPWSVPTVGASLRLGASWRF